MVTNEHIEWLIKKIRNTRITQKQVPKIPGVQPTISMRFITKDLELIESALKMYLEAKKNVKKT